jgi:hypothetical protein
MRAKRSTQKGEARTKLIAALNLHHDYANGGCLNQEPIGNNRLARLANVDISTASDFFKRVFGGYKMYRVCCREVRALRDKLRGLNEEFCPYRPLREDYAGPAQQDDDDGD